MSKYFDVSSLITGKVVMKLQGTFHCYINYEFQGKKQTFHFSGVATEQRQIKAIGCICSGLLQQMCIVHDVNFEYRPTVRKIEEGDEDEK